jgi:hypothetical protein
MKKPNEPYEVETDGNGLNTDLSPLLIEAALDMPVRPSTFERPVLVDDEEDQHIERRTTECVRCEADNVVIWPDTTAERVGHLTREHGYRMDGRRYDNANAMVA